MKKIFWNILDRHQQETLKTLSGYSKINDFYLGGGTGLALQIGHRKSLDFDFFSKRNKLFIEDRKKIKNYLKTKGKIKLLQDKDNILDLIFNNIHVSFFYYPYPLVKSLSSVKKILFPSIEDIGLMKISAIASRGSKKDFIDVYFICKKIPLEKLFLLGRKKFIDVYDFQITVLKALTYFADAENEKIPKMMYPIGWSEVKSFFVKTSKNLLFK